MKTGNLQEAGRKRPAMGLRAAGGLSVEEVRDNWAKIADPSGQQAYVTGGEQSGKFFRKLQGG